MTTKAQSRASAKYDKANIGFIEVTKAELTAGYLTDDSRLEERLAEAQKP